MRAGSARFPRGSGKALRGTLGIEFFLEFFACVVALGEARHDCFSQCNASADVAQAHSNRKVKRKKRFQ